MDQFLTFLQEGFFHILDLQGYDHILFLFAICAIYTINDWKRILWIVTSFTIAHSITLALCVLNIISINGNLVEFLIAFTIFFTCVENLFIPQLHNYRVLFSGFFGLIHGMGFSRLLKDLFMGMEFNAFTTLLPFNLGLEFGQVIIISFILTVIYCLIRFCKLQPKTISYLISIPVLAQSAIWMWQRFPW
ncbi:HupE/UreJ family protein [Solitalea sp. MAHUQ-68]|uniref:HupE/UreJ family protein n=1 Tax=Solitalea agri TaxID=2953739 RepID=A0A9X2F422_9SPHI|nr:HupE/UreJ family protein [Solitalea agri]MCO4291961.1 HupE/UreJ family protein [Solitalea agri]